MTDMKQLTVIVDGRVFFEGDVAEFGWQESAESVGLTARLKPSPTLMDSLKQLSTAAKKQGESNDSPARPTLDVVRGGDED